MTGDEPEMGRPHHLRPENASRKTRNKRELSADVSEIQNVSECPNLAMILFCNGSRKS